MTAEEYMMENMQGADYQEIEDTLIGFAKLKCQELLEIVAEKSQIKTATFGNIGVIGFSDIEYKEIDKDSILNCVDLDSFIV